MGNPISDRQQMIAAMAPKLQSGRFHFCTVPSGQDIGPLLAGAIAIFREAEGVSVILSQPAAIAAGFAVDQPMACISLTVHSSLVGVGLTAAVATTLGDAGIACNMVAAYHHDHAFVPFDLADRAIELLQHRARIGG